MVVTETKASKKRKPRLNKNKKKNWRKADISEIEDALDKQRLEQRTDGLIARENGGKLFTLEKESTETKPSLKRKRERRLMVDKILVPDPGAIKPPTNRNAAKLRRKANNEHYLQKIGKPVKRKSLPLKGVVQSKKRDKNYDIWSNDVEELKTDIFKVNKVTKHTDVVTHQIQRTRPKHLEKKSRFDYEPVQVAHPGASYNPTIDDHQELLRKEHNREVIKVKAANRIERAISTDPNQIATPQTRKAEMEEGLFESDESEEDGDIASETLINRPSVKREKKSAKIRRREKKQLQQVLKKNAKKFFNIRSNEVYRIKQIKREIELKEKQQAEKRAVKAQRMKAKRPTLSSAKYEEPDHALQLSNELQGSLRQLKPEGDILVDRYKSLQRRCLIEPRVKAKRQKRNKQKWIEKRAFKEIEI